jgi:TRAP-type C4-dicarboxylate transport system permease small subunit
MITARGMTDNERRLSRKTLALITWVSVSFSIVPMTAIVLLVFIDVCGRYLLNQPLPGSYDLVEQSLVILSGFSIAVATLDRIHPAIDLLTQRFPKTIQTAMDRAYSFLGFVVSAVVTYSLWLVALRDMNAKATLLILKVSTVPFILLLAFGMLLCTLTLLIQTFLPQGKDADKEEAIFNE